MSSTSATILATIISAVISVSVAVIAYMSARAASERAIQAKLSELMQGQLTEVLHKRIEYYPSLWKLCQGSIVVPILTGILPAEGWDAELVRALEEWHAEHGIFLSQDSYHGILHLRQRARHFAAQPTSGEPARTNLRELEKIWSDGFTDGRGTARDAVAALLKNDLGSYGRAALSIPVR